MTNTLTDVEIGDEIKLTQAVEKDPSFSLETKIVRRIEEIPASDWESVYPQALEGYRFFKALDDSNFSQFSLYYIMVYHRGKAIAAATCFLMSYSLDTTIQGPVKTFTSLLRKIFPDILDLKTLMCGSPVAPGRLGVYANDPDVFEAVYQAIEYIAEKEKVAIIAFKDFDPSYRDLFSGLGKKGFHRFDSFPNTVKKINYKNFEEYSNSLSSKTRYDLKRKFKKVDGQVSIDLEIAHDLGETLEEAYGLYRQMVLRHEVEFETLPKEFFINVSKQMPDETHFFLWRIEGKLVAFSFCLVSEGYFLDFYLGLDYAVAHEYHLYFVRFRDLMNWCIQNGIRRYEMGCTNYDPKKRLGFELTPLDIYAKHRNYWINSFFGIFCRFLEPKRFDPVLKKMHEAQNNSNALTWGTFFMVMLTNAVNGIGQMLMKKGLPQGIDLFSSNGLHQLASLSASSGLLWLGILVYASNFFLWAIVLSRLELTVAIVLTSVSYLILPLISVGFLHEKVSPLRWGGIFLIMLGICMVSWNSKESAK